MSLSLLSQIKGLMVRWLPDKLVNYLAKFYYARNLSAMSETEEPDFAVVRYLVKPGDFVVDVGANVGDYTKFLSELVGPAGKVIAIEPVPRTFELLTSCIAKLKLSNATPLNYAVSDEDGSVEMEIPVYSDGHSNFYQAHIVAGEAKGNSKRFVIQARKLDSILKDSSTPFSFFKCDVEGHELPCLRGSAEILARSEPAWLIEFSSDPDDSTSGASQVVALMKGYGYGMYWYDGEKLRARQRGDSSVNYFLLKEAHLRALSSKLAIVELTA